MGRPYTTTTPQLVDKLIKEFAQKPFNISRRAKELGISRSTLGYHLRGGISGRYTNAASWVAAVKHAYRSAAMDNKRKAAAWLKIAAQRILAS